MMDKPHDIKKMQKIKCPYCGHAINVFHDKDAVCRGVFFKCKNPYCRKEFELRI